MAILIGNGADIQPLEMGRKGPARMQMPESCLKGAISVSGTGFALVG